MKMMEELVFFLHEITHLLLLNDSDMLMKIMMHKGWSLYMKTVTVYDIAREAGVSVATVSRPRQIRLLQSGLLRASE